jgi:3-oxoacyl-[acyl-carrier-protein] synthase-3
MGITGWGIAVPRRTVTNAELAARFGVDEGWIVDRTGIHERRVVGPGESTASLAADAGRRALARAGLTGADIAHLLVATATPEQPCPATAAFVHHELGIAGSAQDFNAECSGAVYGLVTGSGLMALDPGPILLIGSDTHSLQVPPMIGTLRCSRAMVRAPSSYSRTPRAGCWDGTLGATARAGEASRYRQEVADCRRA